eukprot:1347988-Amphidinium_carterae.1
MLPELGVHHAGCCELCFFPRDSKAPRSSNAQNKETKWWGFHATAAPASTTVQASPRIKLRGSLGDEHCCAFPTASLICYLRSCSALLPAPSGRAGVPPPACPCPFHKGLPPPRLFRPVPWCFLHLVHLLAREAHDLSCKRNNATVIVTMGTIPRSVPFLVLLQGSPADPQFLGSPFLYQQHAFQLTKPIENGYGIQRSATIQNPIHDFQMPTCNFDCARLWTAAAQSYDVGATNITMLIITNAKCATCTKLYKVRQYMLMKSVRDVTGLQASVLGQLLTMV